MTSEGVVTKASPHGVDETVRRLVRIIDAKGLTLFSIIDHSGAAIASGLELPNTKLVLFGSPVAGTPIMVATPLAALDLPLKLLVWEDAHRATWVSYNAAAYLSNRHHLDVKFEAVLAALDPLSDALIES